MKTKEIIALATGLLLIRHLLQNDDSKPVGALGRLPVGGGIRVPLVAKSFYPDSLVAANRSRTDAIYRNYGMLIDRYARLCGIRPIVLTAFVFIESAGNARARSGAALGLMQVDVPSATTAIYMARRSGLLTSELRAELVRVIGTGRMNLIDRMRNQSLLRGSTLTPTELLRPETNLLMGAILLMVLIQRHTENGLIRFDKVVITV